MVAAAIAVLEKTRCSTLLYLIADVPNVVRFTAAEKSTVPSMGTLSNAD